MKVKSIILLLLILKTVILAGCSSKDEKLADNWTTYKSDEYGYAFKYPPYCFYDSTPEACGQSSLEEVSQECLCFLNKENPDKVILQTFLPRGEQLMLAEFSISFVASQLTNADLITQLKQSHLIAGKLPDKPNFDLHGRPAVKIYYPRSAEVYSQMEIYLLNGYTLLKIHMLDVDAQANQEFYDQILSTFTIENLPNGKEIQFELVLVNKNPLLSGRGF
jgi:hypothetical protein